LPDICPGPPWLELKQVERHYPEASAEQQACDMSVSIDRDNPEQIGSNTWLLMPGFTRYREPQELQIGPRPSMPISNLDTSTETYLVDHSGQSGSSTLRRHMVLLCGHRSDSGIEPWLPRIIGSLPSRPCLAHELLPAVGTALGPFARSNHFPPLSCKLPSPGRPSVPRAIAQQTVSACPRQPAQKRSGNMAPCNKLAGFSRAD